ncbi:MAG: aldo/keto reductase [Terricaulis silvestris]
MPSLTVERLGLGGAGIGNLYRAVSDADAEATVHAALAAGFGLIDTAPYYGHGLSETRIGAALRGWRGARPALSSKVGRVLDPVAPGATGDFGFADPLPFRPRFDYSRDGVRRSLEGSLERLGVEKLDVALVHDIGALTHGVAHAELLRQVMSETLPELARAKDEGLVCAIGLGVNEVEICFEMLARAPLDCILLAGRYTLLEQPALASGLFALCAERGVNVFAAGVFNSGLLATPPSAASTYNYVAAPDAIVARASALWALCVSFGAEPQAAALQFAGAHPAVTRVIVGARSAVEIADIARWRAAILPADLWTALKREGFINRNAPTP